MIVLRDSTILNAEQTSVGIREGKITFELSTIPKGASQLALENTITFPGLINSHDHLDYNLLPLMDTGVCKNYVEWSKGLAHTWQKEINAIRKVPEDLSTQWGLYKNLINGITHVVNHNETIDIKDPLINIFKKCYSLHSVTFQHHWKRKLNNPFARRWPFVFHIGEGIDEWSKKEVDTLIKWNLFGKKLIGVHAVAMTETQAKNFKALVWCPASNFSMFNKTADVNTLKQKTTMLFGTDSTLSAHWSIWQHLHQALGTGMAGREEIVDMLTANAAKVWKLKNYGMNEGDQANLVVAKKKSADRFDAFFKIRPEDILLVVCNGQLKLVDQSISHQLKESHFRMENFSTITIENSVKHVYGNLPQLVKDIRSYCPAVSFPFTF
jgi:cytosine/adenosine deaminase-related metal-dependent hydrolase